jgi:hypothetical protein
MMQGGRSRCQCFLLLCLTGTLTGTVSADLLVAENSLKPWPSGHGESPPPIGSLVRLNASGFREVVATGLVDPVWVVGSSDGAAAYVGLFHSGEVVRVSLRDGRTTTVARGLSCPEGVALDDATNNLYVVENPVGDECRATFPIKKAAQLTRIDLRSGKQAKVVGLRRWACALCPALPGELQGVFVCTRWLTNWRPLRCTRFPGRCMQLYRQRGGRPTRPRDRSGGEVRLHLRLPCTRRVTDARRAVIGVRPAGIITIIISSRGWRPSVSQATVGDG